MEASQIQHGEPRRLVMSAPTPLRQDFDASQLRGLARKTKDGPQARRLLALAAIYDGATRTEAAKIGGVGLQIIRDWVLRFSARGPDGLLDGKSTGQPSKLNDTQRQAIAGMIESGPIAAVHGVVRWRLIDLAQWIFEEFRITIAKQTLSRELRAMGPRDQRTASTYIFGAVCPKRGKGAALILPACNTEAMNLHLAEIAAAVAPAAHAVLLVDQAGWHMSTRLVVPANITIIALPPKCPELNPVENVWQFMRDNWLSNRIFKSYDDLVDHCCEALNKLVDQPWRIMSIGLRQWAHEF